MECDLNGVLNKDSIYWKILILLLNNENKNYWIDSNLKQTQIQMDICLVILYQYLQINKVKLEF